MGTRGLFGFFYKGRLYLVYNHFDSYPSGLGLLLVREIQTAIDNNELDFWKELLERIIVIDCESSPSQIDVYRLRNFTDLMVSDQSTSDWYCLTHKCKGSLYSVLQSGYLYPAMDTNEKEWSDLSNDYETKGILEDYEDYGYVLNFDENTFDVFGCNAGTEEQKQRKIFPLSCFGNVSEFFKNY